MEITMNPTHAVAGGCSGAWTPLGGAALAGSALAGVAVVRPKAPRTTPTGTVRFDATGGSAAARRTAASYVTAFTDFAPVGTDSAQRIAVADMGVPPRGAPA